MRQPIFVFSIWLIPSMAASPSSKSRIKFLTYIVLAVLGFGSISHVRHVVQLFADDMEVVDNYNSLRQEVDTLRNRYQALERESNQKSEQSPRSRCWPTKSQSHTGSSKSWKVQATFPSEGKLIRAIARHSR